MAADNGVFCKLRIGTEVRDSEATHRDRQVEKALRKAEVEFERFVEKATYTGG